MKKILTIVTTSVIVMSFFAGCGSQTKSSSTQSSTTTQSSSTSNTNSTSATATNDQNKKMPGLAGEVSSISGNQVTLKLIELPTMAPDKNAKPQDGQSANQGAAQDGQKTDGKQPNEQAGQKPKMEVKYTGETKTITISDGASITTLNRGEKDAAQKTIAVKDIIVGNRLDIFYTDSNKTTIANINVLESNQN